MESKRRKGAILVGVVVAILGTAAFLIFGNFASDRRQGDPQQIARGQTLYGQHCASCHGVQLEGQDNWQQRGADGLLPAPPHDETGHTWHHPDQQLFQIVRRGTAALVGGGYKTTRTGFADRLSDADIEAVIAYIKSR